MSTDQGEWWVYGEEEVERVCGVKRAADRVKPEKKGRQTSDDDERRVEKMRSGRDGPADYHGSRLSTWKQ